MKTILRAYLSKKESSFQEAVHHILSEFELKRVFLAVNIVNINVPEEKIKSIVIQKGIQRITQ